MKKSFTIVLTICSLLFASSISSQTDVPIPFEQEGFIYDYPNGSMLVLDVGENLFEVSDSLNVTLNDKTQFTDKKGKKQVKIEDLVPGSMVKVVGERSRANSTYTALKVQLVDPPKEFKVKGYFERLDKTSAGEIAWVSGQAVKLGTGVSIIGDDEWKGKTFASFNDMMLGSKVEMKIKMDPNDKRFVVLEGKTKPNLYSFNDKKLKESVQKESSKYVNGLTASDVKVNINAPGQWEFKNRESGQVVIGQIPKPKPETPDTYQVTVAGKQYDLTTLPKYVESVGNKIIPQYIRDLPDTDPGKIKFKFFVAKDDNFNAFALPDGTIVVHTGLLQTIRNESQLASVLGHEIAHVTHEHSRRQMESGNKLAWIQFLSTAATGINTGTFMNLIKLGFSRQLEDEADRVGLFYTANAGYDPRESPRVWQQIVDAKGKTNETKNFFTSGHSIPEDRLKNLNKEIYRHYKNYDFATTDKGEISYALNVGTAFGWVDYSPKKGNAVVPTEKATPKPTPKPTSKPKPKPKKP